jgi:hypothetical protein
VGWRRLLLVVIALGTIGLLIELLLLGHWISTAQLIPLSTLGLMLIATGLVAVRAERRPLRAFRASMVWAVVAGLMGIGFHLRDNVAFEREIVPDASGASILWHALQGATPLLAPGGLVQLGLIGLIFVYGHPGLRHQLDQDIST